MFVQGALSFSFLMIKLHSNKIIKIILLVREIFRENYKFRGEICCQTEGSGGYLKVFGGIPAPCRWKNITVTIKPLCGRNYRVFYIFFLGLVAFSYPPLKRGGGDIRDFSVFEPLFYLDFALVWCNLGVFPI